MYHEFFEKLKEECKIRSCSSNTARTCTDNIKRFLLDVDKHPDQPQLDDARQYILIKRREGLSKYTVTTSIQPLLSFINMSCISYGIKKLFPEC